MPKMKRVILAVAIAGIIIILLCAIFDPLRRKTGKTYLAIARWIQPIFAIVLILLGAIFMMRIAGINLW